jgi:hypothetical protein
MQTGEPPTAGTPGEKLQHVETSNASRRMRPNSTDRTGLGNMKSTELANLCPDTHDEGRVATETGLTRIGSSYDLRHAIPDHAELSL